MRLNKILIILFCSLFIFSCSQKEEDSPPEIPIYLNSQIITFRFKPQDNQGLLYNAYGVINENTKEIKVELIGEGIDLTNLIPTITIDGVSILPNTGESQDFSSTVNYIVTAKDESEVEYSVDVTVVDTENDLFSFIFKAENNPGLSNDITATIDEENKRIRAIIPHGVDITSLTPTLSFSEKAVSDPENNTPSNFEYYTRYSIVSEDGLRNNYDVDIRTEISEKELNVLKAIVNANPDNTLDWDLTSYYSDTWKGLDINKKGFITAINLIFLNGGDSFDAKITTLPEELTDLEFLRKIDIRESRDIVNFPVNTQNMLYLEYISIYYAEFTEFPKGITNLPNLKDLELRFSSLNEIPDAIGNLTNLVRLDLNSSSYTSISPEIGKLTNLTTLSFNKSNSSSTISAIPEELGNLTALKHLDLSYCSMSVIPDTFKNLTNLETLNLRVNDLTSLPEELAFLTNLTDLELSFNDLTELPAWISDLINLNDLNIFGNVFTSIPQIVCDLESTGTKILKSTDVICE